MTLGERIKAQRNKSGLSQEKIAELVGISRQAVTKWESGQPVPSMANLITLYKPSYWGVDSLSTSCTVRGSIDRLRSYFYFICTFCVIH